MDHAQAKTFLDDTQEVTVDVLTGPSGTGLCKVAFGSRVFARHVDRLEPLNEQARIILKRPNEKNRFTASFDSVMKAKQVETVSLAAKLAANPRK